jgi:hypothetical protein
VRRATLAVAAGTFMVGALALDIPEVGNVRAAVGEAAGARERRVGDVRESGDSV